jgi:ElaA protein
MNWICKYFEELSLKELYEIGRLRQEVFVLEQNCPYVDFDGKDYFCYHLMGMDDLGKLVAYSRIVPKGVSYDDYISIGRVITSGLVRKSGLGRILMQESISACEKLFGKSDIKISAQTYLLKFYQSLDFESTGKEYLEDDIPHTEMIIKLKKES